MKKDCLLNIKVYCPGTSVEKLPLNKSQRKVFCSGVKKFSSQHKEHHQCYSQFYTKCC